MIVTSLLVKVFVVDDDAHSEARVVQLVPVQMVFGLGVHLRASRRRRGARGSEEHIH